MQRKIIIIFTFILICACKSNLNVTEFKTLSINNDKTISDEDSLITKFVEPYAEELNSIMNEVIIQSACKLDKNLPESKLTNCIADIFMESSTKLGAKLDAKPIPDIAYINYHSIRTDFPIGNITLGKIYEAFPFENKIVYIKISGAKLLEFANITASRGGDCIAGATIKINKENKLVQFLVNGKPIDNERYYWVVTSDYIANGGDAMTMFLQAKMRIDSEKKVRDIFIETMREMNNRGELLNGKLDGRISYEQ